MIAKLLITGANGFVGAHLVEEALINGYMVFAAVRTSSDVSYISKLGVTLVYPDYSSIDQLVKLLDQYGITHIAHIAGLTKGKTAQDYIIANKDLTLNLAQAAMKTSNRIQKFVFLSSLAAMGPQLQDSLITEENQSLPVTHYGKSKLLAEQGLLAIKELPLIILRPTAVYGPRDKDMFILIKMVKKGWELYIGKKEQTLSFIYVKDLCSAILQSLNSSILGSTFILSDGKNYDRYKFASLVKDILNNKTAKLHLPTKMVEILIGLMSKLSSGKTSILNHDKLKELTGNWGCSIVKATNELNFRPKYSLRQGLVETIQWNVVNKQL